ncbi:hypothetical protein P3T23_007361, partial [Paraburkholderia sp. GAS448]|uniref:ESPR-type extended signal peptide-containing protein n=1 Tax=Paraburkholderia sp. GAS448 TaxID=3035136 RepID=UPI003D225743
MNKIFRVVWSRARSAYVVVGEDAQCSRGGMRSEKVEAREESPTFRLRGGRLALECGLAFALIGGGVSSAMAAATYVGGIFVTTGEGSGTGTAKCTDLGYGVYNGASSLTVGYATDKDGTNNDANFFNQSKGNSDPGPICGVSDVATQTNRILAWANDDKSNATNMSIGGDLYVNGETYLNHVTINDLTITGTIETAPGAVDEKSNDAVNGSQMFGLAQSVADSLGGGSTVNTDGTITAPSYSLAGGSTTVNNVGDAVANIDGRVTQNAGDISDLKDSLTNGGVIDPTTGQSLAVVYDSAAKNTVTLGGTGAKAPVTLSNVAAGALNASSTDAVNGSQLFATNQNVSDLKDSLQNGGLIDPTTGASLAVVYDGAAKNKVTLGGTGASSPVTLSNVATGTAGTDAVNVDQLNKAVANAGGGSNPYIGGFGSGAAASATALNSVAIGLGSVANQAGTVSVGNAGLQRRITNVADGTAASDAATLGQVQTMVGGASASTMSALSSIGDQVSALSTRMAAQPLQAAQPLDSIGLESVAGNDPYVQVDGAGDGSDNASVQSGNYGIAIGAMSKSSGFAATAIGAQSTADGSGAMAIGMGASAIGQNAQAVGSNSSATQTNALAVGNGSNATGASSTALGFTAQATASNAIAIGNGAGAKVADAISVGTLTSVATQNSVAIGRLASVGALATNSVALGANSTTNRANTVSVGAVGSERQIINVAAGTGLTDAVNVSQLTDVTTALGGGASVGADGSIVAPSYTVNGETYQNVGDAIAAAASGSGGGTDQNAVQYDTSAHDSVTLGNAGTPVAIHNVAAGAVNASSVDAVNGSQLFDVSSSVADALGGGSTVNADGTVSAPSYVVGGT